MYKDELHDGQEQLYQLDLKKWDFLSIQFTESWFLKHSFLTLNANLVYYTTIFLSYCN